MRLNHAIHAILCHVVQHLDRTFGWVGQRNHFGHCSFIRCNAAETSLVQTCIDLLNQLQGQEGENEGLMLQYNDHHIFA